VRHRLGAALAALLLAVPQPTAATPPRAEDEVSYRVARGLTFRQWDLTVKKRPVRAHLLTVDPSTRGLRFEYSSREEVTMRGRLTRLLRDEANVVAGVNTDFFDIHDTGAPLGVGIERGRLLHGPSTGWVSAFVVGPGGRPQIKRLPVNASIAGRPDIVVAGVNTPHVPRHGIGLYTPRWGSAPGYHVTDGARRRDVRQVVVRDGRVVSNSRAVDDGTPIVGRLLLGRGEGASDLAGLQIGAGVRLRHRVDGSFRVAVGGSQILLRRGESVAVDDREPHPRTAVGIDRDTGRLLFLVVDGRQDFSAGVTLAELADLLLDLGAERALNFDGGGSSTMVARSPQGDVGVVNSPSAGRQRRIAQGLAITSTQ
jgi:hypothetical protein